MPSKQTLRERPSIFKKSAGNTAENTAGEPPPQQRIKRTYLLTQDDDIAVDTLVSLEFRATGAKPDKSAIVSRAIQEYFQRHSGA